MVVRIQNRKILFGTLIVTVFSLVVSMAIGRITPRYYINFSSSEPPGIYQLTPFGGLLRRGDRVVMEPPKQARPYVYGRGWLPEGCPLIKNVGALPGDRVRITDTAIFVDGRYVGPVYRYDSQGLPLPHLRGLIKMYYGMFLPISTRIPNSFDGRYFGPVPSGLVRGKAVLVFRF